MNKINSLLLVSLVSSSAPTLGSALATDKISADDFSIVAGQRVGPVRLGDSQEKVRRMLGSPSMMSVDGGLGYGTQGYDSGLSISYNNSKVWNIRVTSNKYRTREGILVGSTANAIRKTFKGGTLSSTKIGLINSRGKRIGTAKLYLYTDAKRGIQFQFGNIQNHSTARCDTITIMKAKL